MKSDEAIQRPEDLEAAVLEDLINKVKKAARAKLFYSEDGSCATTVHFWCNQVISALKSDGSTSATNVPGADAALGSASADGAPAAADGAPASADGAPALAAGAPAAAASAAGAPASAAGAPESARMNMIKKHLPEFFVYLLGTFDAVTI